MKPEQAARGRGWDGVLILMALAFAAALVPPRNSPVTVAPAPALATTEDEAELFTAQAELDLYRGKTTAIPAGRIGQFESVTPLIALVPNPNTGMGFLFNRHISALKKALANSGFTLVAGRIAWSKLDQPIPDKPDAAAAAAGAGAAAKKPPNDFSFVPGRGLRGGTPGVLIFQSVRAGGGDRPLAGKVVVVLLVGESPIKGVDVVGLSRAYRQSREIEQRAIGSSSRLPRDGRCAVTHAVLGPNFTGSAWSFTDVSLTRLEAKGNEGECIDALTPSATNLPRWPAASSAQAVQRLSLRATTLPDPPVIEAFTRHLREELGVLPSQVALLTEETAYGASLAQDSILRLSFPYHVSQVRAAYTKLGTSAARPTPYRWTQQIELPLEGHEDDEQLTVPITSKLDAVTSDLALTAVGRRLAERNVLYVGIAASDVRDRIFLTQHIRRHSRDINVFFLTADALLAHPDVQRDLAGSLVLSPYVLSPDLASRVPSTAGSFPSSMAEGVYNAALALLRTWPSLEANMSHVRLVEYGRWAYETTPRGENEPDVPPLWILQVGSSGLVPLRMLEFPTDDAKQAVAGYTAPLLPSTTPGPPRVAVPIVWDLMVSGLPALPLLMATFILVTCWSGKWPSRMLPAIRVLRRLTGPELERGGYVQRCVQFAALTCCLALFVVCAARAVMDTTTMWTYGLLAPVGAAAWVYAVARVAASLTQAREPFTRFGWAAVAPPLAVVLWSTAVLVVAVWWSLPSLQAHLDLARNAGSLDSRVGALVESRRMADLLGGLSPLPALMLLTMMAMTWCVLTLRRIRLSEAFQSRDGTLPFEGEAFAGVITYEARLRSRLGGGAWRDGSVAASAVAAAVVSAVVWYGQRTRTMDGHAAETLYALAFGGLATMILVTAARLRVVWRHLSELLRRFAATPLLPAFARLPEHLSWQPVLGVTGHLPRFGDLYVSLEAAEQISSRIKLELPGWHVKMLQSINDQFSKAAHHYRRAWDHAAEDTWEGEVAAIRERQACQEELNKACGALYLDLRTREDAADVSNPVPLFLASRVMGLLRPVIAQLRTHIVLCAMGTVVLLVASAIYPFQPHSLITLLNVSLTLIVTAVIVSTLIEIDKDVVLSYVANSDPNKVNWNRDFIGRLLVYGAVPIISLVATQSPELGGLLATVAKTVRGGP